MNNKMLILCLLSCILTTENSICFFSSLSSIKEYANSIPEYVKAENNNWVSPRFTQFHKSITPGVIGRFLQLFGLAQKEWRPKEFKKLTEDITRKRELNGYLGEFVLSYEPKKGDQFYIWTDLFGAFHSLVRDLEELKNQGVLNDKLEVTKPHCWLVFNGNVIDHSPYVLETLTLVLRLLERNPTQVLYLQGDHEAKQEWHSYELAKELEIRAAHVSSTQIPLNVELTKFFNTLPLGLYLEDITKKEIDLALITNNKIMKRGLNEKTFGAFFEQQEEARFAIRKLTARPEVTKKPVHLKAIITGEDRSVSYRPTKGLLKSPSLEKTAVWTIFSSPTSRNRSLYEFSYDAFVRLSILNGMSTWILQLFNQDVRTLQGFAKGKEHRLITIRPKMVKMVTPSPVPTPKKEIQPTKPKKIEEEIPPVEAADMEEGVATIPELEIASIIDITKGTKLLGRALKAGVEIRIKRAEEEGQEVPQILFIDDQYTPTITRKEVEKLLARGVNTILCPEGSPTLASYLDLVKQGRISVFFPATGAPIARHKDLKTLINFRPSYKTEGEILTKYALDTFKSKKGFMFYQKDAFGEGLLHGAQDVLKERGITGWIPSPYERNEVNFKKQVQQALKEDPDVILFFSTTFAAQEFIRQIGVEKLLFRKLMGCSDFGEDQFVTFAKDKGIEVIYLNVVPNPLTSKLPMVKEFREMAEKNNISLDTFSLEGYISTDLMLYAIYKLQPPYNRFKIMESLEKIKDMDYKGLHLNFNPENRTLSHTFWLNDGKGEWKMLLVSRTAEKKEVVMPDQKSAQVA